MKILRRWKKGETTPDPQLVTTNPAVPNIQLCSDTNTCSAQDTSAPSFPDGVKILHDSSDAIVDICFVHGLTGDRDTTWTAEGQSAPWPKTILPQRLARARILSYGYDAYVIQISVSSSNRLIDHASNLLHDLATDRAGCNALTRPLVFVAHSLGGLVCKEAILLSRNNPEQHLRSVFDCVKGIIFMGTPHKGSWMAGWAKIPASTVGLVKFTNKSLLELLEIDNQFLESIHHKFLATVRELREHGRPFEITCFFEELPLPVVGIVVSKESATCEGYDSIGIHANHRNMVRFASAEENGFKRLLGELIRWTSQTDKIQSSPKPPPKALQGCLRSLAFPEMHSRFHDINRPVAGTCEWLIRHDTYEQWATCDRGLLWIKGKPGSGKSTLLRYAIESQAVAPGATDGDLVLSFIFHGRGDELQRTPLGFFRSLIHQALSQAPLTLTDLIDTFERKCHDVGEPGQKWQWHQEELRLFFELFLPKVLETRSVWLYVDALDECGKEVAIGLFRWFKSLLRIFSSTVSGFHICVTCRHYPILDRNCEFEICPESENHKDISTYVQAHLSNSHDLHASSIPELITSCASGVFMWACLMVKQVLNLDNEGAGLGEIKRRIRSTPPELDELYQNLVQEMSEKSVSLKLFQWVCCSTRPLLLHELRWAMAVDADCPHRLLTLFRDGDFCRSDNSRLRRRVQTLSCGLVEIIPSARSMGLQGVTYCLESDVGSQKHGEATEIVQFIHQSVKDFFTEKGLLALDGRSQAAGAVLGMAHFQLSRICIRYLLMEEISQSISYKRHDINSAYPFLHYATISWVVHTQQSDSKGISQDDILDLFDWPSNNIMSLWRCIYEIMDSNSDACPSKGTELIHISSRFGISGLLTAMLQKIKHAHLDPDILDETSMTPLLWAAANGHNTIVELLLATDMVNVNAQDKSRQTPLSRAAAKGHETVVRLLLTIDKVDVNIQDKNGQTPLSWATAAGHEAVIKILLNTDKVNINLRDNMGRTPLLWAIGNGHEAVVKLLLATSKVDINIQDRNNWAPLLLAAKKGHDAIVKLLIAMDEVNIDIQDKNGWTPLLLAARNGHEAVVKLLLTIDKVNINEGDRDSRTPLSWAAAKGREAVVGLLLAIGKADINILDKNGWTPLSWAARNGHDAVIIQLLAKDMVDVNLQDEYGRTPLSWATGNGREGVVKLLLARDKVDINLQDNKGYTPLSWALKNRHKVVVELLLASGKVDINLQDNKGYTPLSWAATNGHTVVVELLLARDKVDVNLQDNKGCTPLSLATGNGREGVVKLLLARDNVDVNAEDRNGRTPLSWATCNGREGVVKLLLARDDVDVNAHDNYGLAPVSWAARNGWEKVIKLLLTIHKVDINIEDKNGRTPLSWAAENGWEGVVKLLLARDDVDVNAQDRYGQTPLLWAAGSGREGVVKLLLATDKVNVNAEDRNGRTPLSWAAENGHKIVVELLLATGKVDANAQDRYGQTPLSWAAGSGREEVVKLLLATDKVNVNAEDRNGRTPLSWAAANGFTAVIRLLLAIGKLDVDAPNKNGWTPLSWAAANGHVAVVRQLLATSKVNIKMQDRSGWTPLSWAEVNGHEAIVRLLGLRTKR